jgi:predicted negative regulator of RcsB-dependent stress response
MATTHTRLTRKELKRPDEFVTLVDWVALFFRKNLNRVILAAVATVVVFVIVFGLYFYSQHQSRLAAEAFYDAVGALEHKDYKAAELGFSRLVEEHPHTNLGRLARFYQANAYLAENQPAKARNALQAYLASGAQRLFRQLALTQLGVADEDLGQYRSARDAYLEAVALDGPQKVRARLGAARAQVRMGDKQGAIAAYRRFLDENPYARERADVTEALVQLGAPPEVQPSKAKTLELAPSGVISPIGAVGPVRAAASPRPRDSAP